MRARCLGGRRVGPRTLRAALVPGILAFEDVERVGDWGRSGASPELWLWVCGAHWVGMGVCEGRGLGRSLRALASNGWNWFSLQPARKASLSAGVRAESFGQRGPLRAPGSHSWRVWVPGNPFRRYHTEALEQKSASTDESMDGTCRIALVLIVVLCPQLLRRRFGHLPSLYSPNSPPPPRPSPDPTRQPLIWSALE